jgi:hypothetical protein
MDVGAILAQPAEGIGGSGANGKTLSIIFCVRKVFRLRPSCRPLVLPILFIDLVAMSRASTKRKRVAAQPV